MWHMRGRAAWVVVFALLLTPLFIVHTSATTVGTTTEPPVDGPFVISGYSFQGHSLRYVQIANVGNSLAAINSWKVLATWDGGSAEFELTSEALFQVAPDRHIIFAMDGIFSQPTSFSASTTDTPSEPRLAAIQLVPPSNLNFNTHTTTISIAAASYVPLETYYGSRNRSGATGDYLSSLTVSNTPHESLADDGPYTAKKPSAWFLRIVEIYANPKKCTPSDVDKRLCAEYVKLYNGSDQPIQLSDFSIHAGSADSDGNGSTQRILPNETVASGEFISIPLTLINEGGWVWLKDTYSLVSDPESVVEFPNSEKRAGESWAYNESTKSWQWTNFVSPGNQPNRFPAPETINDCSEVRLSEIGAHHDPQFIEVHNPTGNTIDISGCKIATNRSDTVYAFPMKTTLSADTYLAMLIEQSGLTLSKTTSGTVYILSSDGNTEVDARQYEDPSENSSFALIGGVWRQTFTTTPGAENIYEEFLPCAEGYTRNPDSGRCNKISANVSSLVPCRSDQYRSPETNRCRLITSIGSTLKPCASNQYRNPETNRCRLIASASSLLTPCKANQFRNPETNRCKSIASTASSLKPCAKDQFRNPETNRCKKKPVSEVLAADFPIEKVAGDTGESTIGWLAFAGVGSMAAGYGVWEWRRELGGLGGKIMGILKK